jgi:hypothetical protein
VSPETLWEWARLRFPGLQLCWVVMPGEPGARYANGGRLFGSGIVEVDRRLRGPEFTCALAEEIGHHATMLVGDLAGRAEERAFRWAAAILLPPAAFRLRDAAAVAERYGVTEAFAARALALGPAAVMAMRSLAAGAAG